MVTLQEQIDAVASRGGGKLRLPVGDFSAESPFVLRHGVRIIGEGLSTRLPMMAAPPARVYGPFLKHLAIRPKLGSAYGLDWRNINGGGTKDVYVISDLDEDGNDVPLCDWALLVSHQSYNNVFEQQQNVAAVGGIQFWNGSYEDSGGNHNTVIGGKSQAPGGVHIQGANFVTVINHNHEGPTARRDKSLVIVGESLGLDIRMRYEGPDGGPMAVTAVQ